MERNRATDKHRRVLVRGGWTSRDSADYQAHVRDVSRSAIFLPYLVSQTKPQLEGAGSLVQSLLQSGLQLLQSGLQLPAM
jgi:hypothetical protein